MTNLVSVNQHPGNSTSEPAEKTADELEAYEISREIAEASRISQDHQLDPDFSEIRGFFLRDY